jgi:hypothetical protein
LPVSAQSGGQPMVGAGWVVAAGVASAAAGAGVRVVAGSAAGAVVAGAVRAGSDAVSAVPIGLLPGSVQAATIRIASVAAVPRRR